MTPEVEGPARGPIRSFYAAAVVLFASGAVWLAIDWLSAPDGDTGDAVLGWKKWSIDVHGGAAMIFLIILGALVPTHVGPGWSAGRNRRSGAFFVAVVSLLVATGYGLYYFGDEKWRAAAHWIHVIVGVATPAVVAWHVWQGRRERRRDVADQEFHDGDAPLDGARPSTRVSSR